MSSRSNLTALLAVLAMAGYQNRDKITEVLQGLQKRLPADTDPNTQQNDTGFGGMLERLASGGLGSLFGGTSTGGILSGGLGGLLDQFRQNGLGDRAETWVKTGPNSDVGNDELEQALGDDVLADLVNKTGLSREEIVSRLTRDLPRAVDDLTPDGEIPTEQTFEDRRPPGMADPGVSRTP